jgi:hypothetical protein
MGFNARSYKVREDKSYTESQGDFTQFDYSDLIHVVLTLREREHEDKERERDRVTWRKRY